MQGKFTTSARATQDIKDIYQSTVLKQGKQQAQIYTDGLKSTLQLLADMPDMGRKCSEIRKGYQRHEYARHIIFYKKRDHDILSCAFFTMPWTQYAIYRVETLKMINVSSLKADSKRFQLN